MNTHAPVHPEHRYWTLSDAEAAVLRRLADLDELIPASFDPRRRTPVEAGPALLHSGRAVPAAVVESLLKLGHITLDGGPAQGWSYVLTDRGADRVAPLLLTEERRAA